MKPVDACGKALFRSDINKGRGLETRCRRRHVRSMRGNVVRPMHRTYISCVFLSTWNCVKETAQIALSIDSFVICHTAPIRGAISDDAILVVERVKFEM